MRSIIIAAILAARDAHPETGRIAAHVFAIMAAQRVNMERHYLAQLQTPAGAALAGALLGEIVCRMCLSYAQN